MANREDTAPVPALIDTLRWVVEHSRHLSSITPSMHVTLLAHANRLEAVSSEPGWVAMNPETGHVWKLPDFITCNACAHEEYTDVLIEEPTDGP